MYRCSPLRLPGFISPVAAPRVVVAYCRFFFRPQFFLLFVASSRFPDCVTPLVCFPSAHVPPAGYVSPILHFRFLLSYVFPVMLPRRASSVASLRCSAFPADSRFLSAGYVSPVLPASCIYCICGFVSCLLGYTAPLRLPGCRSVDVFLPRLPVSLLRRVFPIALPRRACSVISPFLYPAICASVSRIHSCNLRAINALVSLGGHSAKMRRIGKYRSFGGDRKSGIRSTSSGEAAPATV